MHIGKVMRHAIPLLIGIALALPAGADEPHGGLYYPGWEDRGGGLPDGLGGPGSWYGSRGHGFAGDGGFDRRDGFGGDDGLDGRDEFGGRDGLDRRDGFGGQDEFGGHGGFGGLGGGGQW